jgi:hypothetical protein
MTMTLTSNVGLFINDAFLSICSQGVHDISVLALVLYVQYVIVPVRSTEYLPNVLICISTVKYLVTSLVCRKAG